MNRITIAQVEHIAFSLARELLSFDEPIPDFSTRYPNMLESCLDSPFQTFGGKSLYPTLIKKTGILFYMMIKNHPFQNGNKRIAVTTLLTVLHREGKWLEVSQKILYKFAVSVAESDRDEKDEMVKHIENFIKNYIVPLNKTRK